MTTTDRTQRKVRAITDQTNGIALAITRGAITKLEEWAGPSEPQPDTGIPPTNPPPERGQPNTEIADGNPIDYNDPTGNSAGTRPDIHAYALREIERILTNVEHELETVADHLRMGLSTRQAEEIKATLPPACKSCARLRDHQKRQLYSPAHGRDLCTWCLAFDREWHQWPPVDVLSAYHGGRRPNRRMIQRAIAQQQGART